MKKIQLLLSLFLVIAIYQLGIARGQSSVGVGLQIRDTFGPGIGLIDPINNSGHFY